MRVLPGTARQDLPDGSAAVFVNHPNVLLDHAVRLQGAVDEFAAHGEAGLVLDRAGIADVLTRWGLR